MVTLQETGKWPLENHPDLNVRLEVSKLPLLMLLLLLLLLLC